MIKRLMLTLAALSLAGMSMSQASTWVADPVHSNLGFKIRHMMIAYVSGTFKDFNARVDYKENDITKSRVEVTVDVGSISTGNEKRDAHLKSADFFDVAKYPTIIFVSKRITETSGGLDVVGDLTLHGVTKEITFTVDGPTPPMKGPMDTRIGASATATIDRQDFGLTYNMPLEGGGVVVGNEVTINIDVELVQQQQP